MMSHETKIPSYFPASSHIHWTVRFAINYCPTRNNCAFFKNVIFLSAMPEMDIFNNVGHKFNSPQCLHFQGFSFDSGKNTNRKKRVKRQISPLYAFTFHYWLWWQIKIIHVLTCTTELSLLNEDFG